MKKTIPAAIRKLSFEDALEELESVINSLEQGAGGLDDSITAYERGILLKNHCEAKLTEARMRIEKIVVSSDGSLTTKPLISD